MRATKTARWGILVALLFLLAPPAGADDVPEAAKKKFAEAKALYLKGDAKSLAGAFSALSEVKAKAPDSADFWELFVRVWRASKKSEADLWEKIIAPREQAVPKSPTFDIVRARVETDTAKKGEFLQKAIEKDPASVPTRLLLVRHLRSTGDETKAEEMLEKILAEKPDQPDALVLKAEMMIEGGLSRTAAKFAKEELEKKDCPALRHALAVALRKQAAEADATEAPKMRAEALEAAKKAVAASPEPAFVVTLADLLDESDKTADAIALLKTHVDKGGDPRLAGRLGAFAFRGGDYDGAVKGLAANAASDAKTAKALALAHARRGRAKEARAALDQALALDKEAAPFAASVELLLGDPAAARKRVAGRTDDPSKALLTRADVMEGKVAEAAASLAKDAAAGTAEGEDALLSLLLARLNAKSSSKLPALRKQVLEARVAAAQGVLPEAKRPEDITVDVAGKSHEFGHRMVGYLRSACGNRFVATHQLTIAMTSGAGKRRAGPAAVGKAECDRDPNRLLRFKFTETEGDRLTINSDDLMNDYAEVWAAAEKGFTEGCAALVAEDAAKAIVGFTQALEAEPEWHRAKLFRAVAKAFAPGADLAAAAKEALDALASMPGDWEGREVALALGLWAGADIAEPLKSLQKHVEERSIRRVENL
jgi:tetratricopeptide (TPR) repeat protein